MGRAQSVVQSEVEAAPPATPAPAAATGAYDNEPLKSAIGGAAGSKAAPGTALSAGAGGLDLPRVCYSLALVLGLVLLLRWGARWFFPGALVARRSGAIRLLARTPLGPKQQVMLIAVGRRVLVVADNGQHMTRLTEITESGEIAGLTVELAQAGAAHEAEKDREEAERAFAHELNDAQSRRDQQTVSEPAQAAAVEPVAVAAALDATKPTAVLSLPGPVQVAPPVAPAGVPAPEPALVAKPAAVVRPAAGADHPAARLAAKLFDRMRASKPADTAPEEAVQAESPAQPAKTTKFPATLFTEAEQSGMEKGDNLGDLAKRIRAMSRQFHRK
jgi:flagellar biogenesis protein FliO